MKQHIDNWAFAATCAAYVLFAAVVLLPDAKGPWCGLPTCSLADLAAGYQTMIVGVGAIAAAYFTVKATRQAAREQVIGALQAAERQIAENKALLETQLAAQRGAAERERRLKGRAVALAVYPAVMEMRARARSMLGFIDKVGKGNGVSRNDDTMHALTVPIPPILTRWSSDLYILGDEPGGDLIQLASMCEMNNRMITESKQHVLMPELHRGHADAVVQICGKIIEALTPIHDRAPAS